MGFKPEAVKRAPPLSRVGELVTARRWEGWGPSSWHLAFFCEGGLRRGTAGSPGGMGPWTLPGVDSPPANDPCAGLSGRVGRGERSPAHSCVLNVVLLACFFFPC